ncbi:hypothetical protein [Pseudomonas sp. 910_23]|uniref:hypothetical protein n=1 Tax=Pseudomonas sp. 910_23 TaxID=2604461 RepID=UPI004063B01D
MFFLTANDFFPFVLFQTGLLPKNQDHALLVEAGGGLGQCGLRSGNQATIV